MRIPTYIQRSRHGIFFRMVMPKALRETSDGQTEVKRSLRTRNLREAMRMACPLCIKLYELFARLEAAVSKSKPTVADILAKAKAGELRASKTITLPDDTQHTYNLETHSNYPVEIVAFERQVERERADLRDAEARYRAKPMEVYPAMLNYQQKALEMAAFKTRLAEERAARERAEARAEARVGIQTIVVQPAASQAPAAQVQDDGDGALLWGDRSGCSVRHSIWFCTRKPF